MFRRWIGILGAVAMAVAPLSAAADETEAGEFVALSYNVAGLPELISGSEPATNSSLISPLLNDYDLVLLQESWAEPHEAFEDLPVFFYHHEVIAEADHAYPSEPAPHPLGTDPRQLPSADDSVPDALNRVGPALVSDGLNRLSRFPFGPLQREMWDRCYGGLVLTVAEEVVNGFGLGGLVEELGLDEAVDGGSADCMAQKGFSVARTELAPGVEVDVYNLHGDAGGHPGDIAARAHNFEQLASFVKVFSGGRAVILGGDTNLNTGSSRPERAEADTEVWESFLKETELQDVCEVVPCGDDAGVIDKFAFRSVDGVEIEPLTHSFEREKFKREDGEPLSDHDPLAVTFRWEGSEGT